MSNAYIWLIYDERDVTPTLHIQLGYIRSVNEKYPTCVHISALVLFLVIRTVASFEVVPI